MVVTVCGYYHFIIKEEIISVTLFAVENIKWETLMEGLVGNCGLFLLSWIKRGPLCVTCIDEQINYVGKLLILFQSIIRVLFVWFFENFQKRSFLLCPVYRKNWQKLILECVERSEKASYSVALRKSWFCRDPLYKKAFYISSKSFSVKVMCKSWKLFSVKFEPWRYLLQFILQKLLDSYTPWCPKAFDHSTIFYYTRNSLRAFS